MLATELLPVSGVLSAHSRGRVAQPRPSAETSEYLVTYAADVDINKAMDAASWNMIELLQKERSLSRLDAYSLASMTMDCRVGETDASYCQMLVTDGIRRQRLELAM